MTIAYLIDTDWVIHYLNRVYLDLWSTVPPVEGGHRHGEVTMPRSPEPPHGGAGWDPSDGGRLSAVGPTHCGRGPGASGPIAPRWATARRATPDNHGPRRTPEERRLVLLVDLTTAPRQGGPGRLVGMGPSTAPQWLHRLGVTLQATRRTRGDASPAPEQRWRSASAWSRPARGRALTRAQQAANRRVAPAHRACHQPRQARSQRP
jgi:hypothetical protein